MNVIFNDMKKITDYSKVFETLVTKTSKYLTQNNINAQIIGISGGIDSTVVAAICHEVSKRTGIPLIGRSLPTKFNKEEERNAAELVGHAFCDDFSVDSIRSLYDEFLLYTESENPVVNGNIQARIRMILLYSIANEYNGLVMDTDNLTEHNLGYFTRHGDENDYSPLFGLWKTEVFKLAEWIMGKYSMNYRISEQQEDFNKVEAITESLKLKPTAGLGITNSDLEEIGAESYEQVDTILKNIIAWRQLCKIRCLKFKNLEEKMNNFLCWQSLLDIPFDVVSSVAERHFKSEFKRKQLPIKITRNEILV